MNSIEQIPGPPALQSPEDQLTIDTLTPLLCWKNSQDGDGDTVSYILEISAENNFNNAGARYQTTTVDGADGPTTCFAVNNPLVEDGTYYWRVRATDGKGLSNWSQTWAFTTNANGAPTKPQIVSPKDGFLLERPTENVFTFTNVVDPEGDAVRYAVTIYSDDKGTQVVLEKNGVRGDPSGQTALTITDTIADGSYWWKVTASDVHNQPTESALAHFTVKKKQTSATDATGEFSTKGGGCQTSQSPTSEPVMLLLAMIALMSIGSRKRRT